MKAKKRTLLLPWWERGGIHTAWELSDGTIILTASGWLTWADDDNAPGKHDLRRRNPRHKKYI